jgi:Mn-dependent DtxR family transcriptional regulator
MSERASGEHAVSRRGQLLNVVVKRRLISFSTWRHGFDVRMMAQVLGVHRPAVTEAAAHLRKRGAITYQRGRISVLDAGALLECACECYAAIKEQIERLPQAWNDSPG